MRIWFNIDLGDRLNQIASRSDIIIRRSTLDVRCSMFSLFDVQRSSLLYGTISTRLFSARPAAVSLDAWLRVAP